MYIMSRAPLIVAFIFSNTSGVQRPDSGQPPDTKAGCSSDAAHQVPASVLYRRKTIEIDVNLERIHV